PNLAVAILGHILFTACAAALLPALFSVVSMAIPPRMRTLGFATGSLWILLGIPLIVVAGAIGDSAGIRTGVLLFVPIFLVGSLILASSGKFLEEDIERINLSARTQSELRRMREEGRGRLLAIRG